MIPNNVDTSVLESMNQCLTSLSSIQEHTYQGVGYSPQTITSGPGHPELDITCE